MGNPFEALEAAVGRRSPCRQRRTPGRTPQQRDRRRMREERTGARPKRQAHTSAPRHFQGGDEQERF